MTDTLSLSHGLRFADLYEPAGLARLDALFLDQLAGACADLHAALVAARGNPEAVERKAESDLLIAVAPHAEDFIGTLFGITNELRTLAKRHTDLAPLFACKRLFVQRRATRAHKEDEAKNFDGAALAAALEKLFDEKLTEESFARHVMPWTEAEAEHTEGLDLATRYAAWALYSPEGKAKHRRGVLFKAPHKIDMQHLVPAVRAREGDPAGALELPDTMHRHREGFALTDAGTDLIGALDQALSQGPRPGHRDWYPVPPPSPVWPRIFPPL